MKSLRRISAFVNKWKKDRRCLLYTSYLKTKDRQGCFMISRKEKETTRRGQAVSTKRTALFGLLIALAFVLGYVESLIPVYLGAPGVKLGLANLVTMITLYCMGVKAAIAVNVVRIFLSGFTFGPASALSLIHIYVSEPC